MRIDWWASWMEDARCRLPRNDPETWFPEATLFTERMYVSRYGRPDREFLVHQERIAKAICFSCPVREPCLRMCLQYEHGGAVQAGIWGGTLKRERQRWKRRKLGLEEQVTAMLEDMEHQAQRWGLDRDEVRV